MVATKCPKDPAVLETLRDSELLGRIFCAMLLGTEKYLPPPPREQEKKIFRGKLWLHPLLR